MKIGIVGYHLFGAGGTSRANINLIKELMEVKGTEIVYYNTKKFGWRAVRKFRAREGLNVFKDRIKYKHFSTLLEDDECDVYMLTRENLFVLARLIKQKFPNALVVGEVHAPLANIEPETDLAPEAIDVYRLATKRSVDLFKTRVPNYKGEMVVYPVSVKHIKYNKVMDDAEDDLEILKGEPSKDFYVYSRFDESQKNISYAIKLMDYLVNFKEQTDFHLYLNGTGRGQTLYQNLVKYYHLEGNVFINHKIPSDAIYLSTARNETFGYSISEAFTAGHKVLLYGGDDHVIHDIYGKFKTFGWLTKDIEHDAQVMEDFGNEVFTKDDFNHDIDEALKYSIIKDYGVNYVKKVFNNKKILSYSGKETVDDIYEIIYAWDKSSRTTGLSTTYNFLNQLPIFHQIFKIKFLHSWLADIYNSIFPPEEEDLPVRDDFAFIESFHGSNFAGDPKYLALELRKRFPKMYIYVSSSNQLVDMEVLQEGFIPIRMGSKPYVRKFKQCKYVITNGNALDKAEKQPGQIFIQTWHGFPLKKMVADLENPEQRMEETTAFLPRMKNWNYILTSSDKNTDYISSAFMFDQNDHLNVLQYGAPRNSYLIKNGLNQKELERIHFKYFNKPYDGKTYVLYCPTWRKDKRKETTQLDLVKLIEDLPEDYELIVKLHPLEGHLRKQYSDLSPRIHCFYNELVDIHELYLLSKVMITDYSSTMFDYAHLNRKIIVFQEDAEEYTKQIGEYFNSKDVIDIEGYNYSEPELVEEILKPYDGYYNQLITRELMTDDSATSAKEVVDEVTDKQNQAEILAQPGAQVDWVAKNLESNGKKSIFKRNKKMTW